METLLQVGADPNLLDAEGNTVIEKIAGKRYYGTNQAELLELLSDAECIRSRYVSSTAMAQAPPSADDEEYPVGTKVVYVGRNWVSSSNAAERCEVITPLSG